MRLGPTGTVCNPIPFPQLSSQRTTSACSSATRWRNLPLVGTSVRCWGKTIDAQRLLRLLLGAVQPGWKNPEGEGVDEFKYLFYSSSVAVPTKFANQKVDVCGCVSSLSHMNASFDSCSKPNLSYFRQKIHSDGGIGSSVTQNETGAFSDF